MEAGEIAPGTGVRLRSDPGRRGTIGAKSQKLADRTKIQVIWPDGKSYHYPDDLEPIEDVEDDPLELVRKGQFGRARDLRGLLTFVRLNGRLANLIYSMETTNTEFFAYQFRPVLSLLDSPSNGILVADEVGLGKTIEAGLIWTELRSRFDARRLLVLCPAMLKGKWQLELLHRFGIDATEVSARELQRKLEDTRAGRSKGFALIGSIQGLAPRRSWESEGTQDPASELARYLDDKDGEEPIVDLLVIDEAHILRNPETTYATLARLLRNLSTHVALLTATPIHLDNQDLFHLLRFVDQFTFNDPHAFNDMLNANEPLVAARTLLHEPKPNLDRLRELLIEAKSHRLMHSSKQLGSLIDFPPTHEELEDPARRVELINRVDGVNLLAKALTRTRKIDVTERKVVRTPKLQKIIPHPEEREFYDAITSVVREFAESGGGPLGFMLATPQRQVSSSMPAALKHWSREYVRDLPIDELDNELYEEFGVDVEIAGSDKPLVSELIRRTRELGNFDRLKEIDTKYAALIEMLSTYFEEHPTEKVILFATFHATLFYLEERLGEDGIPTTVLIGGNVRDRYDRIEQFRKDDESRVLLASEVASEGIDLQFSRVLVNYDLPWNPMRVEQRIGRLDRIGQASERILIWNLVYVDTIDERIYERLYNRLGIFERALGGLEAILGEEIGKLTKSLLAGKLTAGEEQDQIERASFAIANRRNEEERLEQEASGLFAHGDYILNKVHAARELKRWITGEDLFNFAKDFYDENYSGSQFEPLDASERLYEVRLSNNARYALDQYIRTHPGMEQTRLSLDKPKPVRCLFDNHVAFDTPKRGTEIVNQWHPLIRFVTANLANADLPYFPLVRVTIDHEQLPSTPPNDYVIAVHRWTVEGIRSVERLSYVVRPVDTTGFLEPSDAEQFVTTVARNGRDSSVGWHPSRTEELSDAIESCLVHADSLHERFADEIEAENDDRAEIQIAALDKQHEYQLTSKQSVMEQHRQAGRQPLVKAMQGQIDRLGQRYEHRRIEIEARRKLRQRNDNICCGVITVM